MPEQKQLPAPTPPSVPPVKPKVCGEQAPREPQSRRPWYWDALASLAFWGQALWLGKFFSRTLGPIAGLFAFLIFGGLGWMFGKAARRGLMEGRERNGK